MTTKCSRWRRWTVGLLDTVDERLLADLASCHGMPMLTIAIPTHRFGPELHQDQVLLNAALDQIADTPDRHAWPNFPEALGRLRHEATLVDLQHLRDGLLVYAGASTSGHLVLDIPVARRLGVGTHIALAPAVQAVGARRPAVVVSITDTGARVWRKVGLVLSEVIDHRFPYVLDPRDDRGQDPREFGRQRSTLERTHRDQIIRTVVERLNDVVGSLPTPIFVAAHAKIAARFEELAGNLGGSAPQRLRVLHHPTPTDLAALARQLDEHGRAADEHRLAGLLADARGSRRLATDLDEITELVSDGNAATLILDEALLTTSDPRVDTRVDHLVATMASRTDEVRFVHTSTLADLGPHVLITRY